MDAVGLWDTLMIGYILCDIFHDIYGVKDIKVSVMAAHNLAVVFYFYVFIGSIPLCCSTN